MSPLELQLKLEKLTLPVLQNKVAGIILKDPKIVARKGDELKAGVNPLGDPIGLYRSEGYKLFKMRRNPFAGGKVDLTLTGDYKRGIKTLSLGNSKFTLRSSDDKRDELISKYGIINEGINQDVWNNLQKFTYAPILFGEIKL